MEGEAENQVRQQVAAEKSLHAKWHMADVPPRDPRPASARQFDGDLRARVSGADDQDAALLQLLWVPVVARMELHDLRIELGREVRHPVPLVVRHRNDHVLGLEPHLARDHEVAVPGPCQPVDPDAAAHRQLEARCVGGEIVRHVVLGRKRAAPETSCRRGHHTPQA